MDYAQGNCALIASTVSLRRFVGAIPCGCPDNDLFTGLAQGTAPTTRRHR
jgi:hypothetical protein